MKLFLSSAGIKPETKDAFLNLLNKNPKECTVAFIPTASDTKPDKSYVKRTMQSLDELGFELFTVDLKKEDENSLYEKMTTADVVFVEGGDPFHLLIHVKKSGFKKALTKLLNEGKIYFGISAGSYIACPTIEMSRWKRTSDEHGLTDISALNLVKFLMSVHYEEKYKEAIERGVKSTSLPVAVLTDKQAIIVNGDKISLAGPEQLIKYNGFSLND